MCEIVFVDILRKLEFYKRDSKNQALTKDALYVRYSKGFKVMLKKVTKMIMHY